MELGCGYFVEMEWPYLTVFFLLKKNKKNIKICGLGHNKYSIPFPHIFFCFTPRNSSSARLGQNSRASKVLVA